VRGGIPQTEGPVFLTHSPLPWRVRWVPDWGWGHSTPFWLRVPEVEPAFLTFDSGSPT
jgi:hypothetical protein